ncbi:MAG: hypothetical protein WDW36_003672 [Sanguina aurantia]
MLQILNLGVSETGQSLKVQSPRARSVAVNCEVASPFSESQPSPGPARHRSQPFFIGVAGGTASGKTTVCDMIMQRLQDSCVVMVSQDSFYKSLTAEERKDVGVYNFDVPSAFDEPALLQCLVDLKDGCPVEIPTYDFNSHSRTTETRKLEPADVVIVEGILVLHMLSIRKMLNMCVFVDTDDDVRLARRIQRDVSVRGRDVDGVIKQYTQFVKPAFDQFVAPSRRHADVIIPWAKGNNIVAIDLITEHIRLKLQQHELRRIYPHLEVIPSNFQIRGMHTIIRDATSSKADFIFYADRLNRLVVEAGLGHLPFTECEVITPAGHTYVGVEFRRGICGVSIIRRGESMESALRGCCKGIKIGKILVQKSAQDQSADIIYEKLPSDVADRHVLLLDPILCTGRTACKAIEVLLSKGVHQNQILLLTIMAAPEGIRRVCSTYPEVTIITSEIDLEVREGQILPGCGDFADRYFCE